MTPKRFIKHVKDECKEHGVKVSLEEKATVYVNNQPCAGYFDNESLELVVAVGGKTSVWLPVLVHEYCHFRQHIENPEIYASCAIDGFDATELLDMWLSGTVEIKKKVRGDIIQKIINLEADCEHRSFETIMQLKLPIDTVWYIKQANAYLLNHFLLIKHRKWSHDDKIPPYSDNTIINAMPDSFVDHTNPPKSLLKIMEKRCF